MRLFTRSTADPEAVDYEAGKKDAALARRGVARLEPDYGTNTAGLARYRQGREDGLLNQAALEYGGLEL